jgi:hypothetical protein
MRSDVDSPSVPYLTPQLGTGHPCTRTSSVLYFLIRYLNPKVGNERFRSTGRHFWAEWKQKILYR